MSILLTIVLLSAIMAGTITIVNTTPGVVFSTTGMSDCRDPDNDNPDCNDQPDRVGNDDDTDTDADRDGPGGEGGSAGDPGQGEDDGRTEANCWGKVTSSLTQNDDGKPGIGEHSSDPVPGDDDNETPREGVGNQREGHPSDHADTVGGLADDRPDCVD
jgi:hypothetical protein